MFESLESRRLLSAGVHGVAAGPALVAHPAMTHRHRVASVLSLLGDYSTTVNYHGVPIKLTLSVDHQHLGHVSGTLDAGNVPFVGTAHVDFTGVVNADNSFALTFSGAASGKASGTFAADLKSAKVSYDFSALGMSFKGTRTFSR